MYRAFATQMRLLVDEVRVRSHLRRVEGRLRSKDVSELPLKTQQARQRRLDALHHYWRYERIPRNFKYEYSIPCFIDRTGGTCAVAHLVIDSGYGDFAQTVVAEANDAYIEDMHFPELDLWANQNGFTKDELAQIQPIYCPTPEDAQLVTATLAIYIVSFLIMIAGLPFALWNLAKGARRNLDGRRAVISGLVTGLLTIIFAIIIALRIATGNDVLSDWSGIYTSYGFNETCEEGAERLITRVTYSDLWVLVAVGLFFLGSAGWRVYRGRKRDGQVIEG